MAFPSSRQVGGDQGHSKGSRVSYCKPETLIDNAPIIYSTPVDRDGPNYLSDLSKSESPHPITTDPSVPMGSAFFGIDSTVFQRAGIRTLRRKITRCGRAATLIYVKGSAADCLRLMQIRHANSPFTARKGLCLLVLCDLTITCNFGRARASQLCSRASGQAACPLPAAPPFQMSAATKSFGPLTSFHGGRVFDLGQCHTPRDRRDLF